MAVMDGDPQRPTTVYEVGDGGHLARIVLCVVAGTGRPGTGQSTIFVPEDEPASLHLRNIYFAGESGNKKQAKQQRNWV